MVEILSYLQGHVFVYISIVLFFSVAITAFLAHRDMSSGEVRVPPNPGGFGFRRRGYSFLMMLLVILGVWSWVVFFPLGFGHRDEIALLTEPLKPTVYSGRFFPMGHMEFNLLSLQRFDGELAFLYLLPLFQVALFCFFVDSIIGPAAIWIRVLTLCAAFWLAALIPFASLIIPERNAILFLLAGFYFIRRYRLRPRIASAATGVGFATLSLYYKEPMFSLLLTFALVSNLYRLEGFSFRWGGLVRVFGPIEAGLTISSVFFLVGYFFYVFFGGGPASFYRASETEIRHTAWIYYFLVKNPVLSLLLMSMVSAHLLVPRGVWERQFAVSLAAGGAVYLAALVVIGLPLNGGYYYSVPLLSMVLSSAIVLKYATLGSVIRSISGRSIVVLMLVAISVVLLKHSDSIVYGLAEKKNYQSEYAFIESELAAYGDFDTLFYSPRTDRHGTYATAVLMMFLHKANVAHSFDIHSDYGCEVWNESYNSGQIRCIKHNTGSPVEFDVLVSENDSVGEIDGVKYRVIRFDAPFEGELCDTEDMAALASGPFVECKRVRNSISIALRNRSSAFGETKQSHDVLSR